MPKLWTASKRPDIYLEATLYQQAKTCKVGMMSLDEALQTSMDSIPECLASGYVDIGSGKLLSVQTAGAGRPEILEAIAKATADLFNGEGIARVEGMLRGSDGPEAQDAHHFNEMIVFSENFLHAFVRTKAFPDHLICFVCRENANPGMVLARSRMAAEGLEKGE